MKVNKKISTLLLSLFLLFIYAGEINQAQAQGVNFETDEGWGLNITGRLPVFLVASNHDSYSTDNSDQFATRVMTGFNPPDITFRISAPEYDGIKITGIFQINHHLHGPSVQNAGLFEGRVADIQIEGNFGTINMGKGFGIYNSNSIADVGSAMGVGRFAGPDAADATLGRIGSGYTFANFNPRIKYTTPNLSGFSLKVGLINPEKPDGLSQEIETSTPRVEGQADYVTEFESGNIRFWAGGMVQSVNVVSENFEYNITGWDVGLRLSAGGLGVTGSYSETSGVGADGLIGLSLTGSGLEQAEVAASQWYTEATYTAGKLTLGASYGEGEQDENSTVLGSSPDIKNELLMIFTRYNVTDSLAMIGELQDFASDAQSDYKALVVGMQFTF
jgi:predicted porin